jgi:hypothetical protein
MSDNIFTPADIGDALLYWFDASDGIYHDSETGQAFLRDLSGNGRRMLVIDQSQPIQLPHPMTAPLFESLANCALSRARLIGATGPCPRYWRELFTVTALIGAPWREADRLGGSVMDGLELQRYDVVDATFQPIRTDDLKPPAVPWVGVRMKWQAAWPIDDKDGGPYVGQMAMTPQGPLPNGLEWIGWVPLCDLVVHQKVTR